MAGELGSSGWAAELETREQRAARLRMAEITGEFAQRASYARAQGCTGREARLAAELTATGLELGALGALGLKGREMASEARCALATIRQEG